MQPPYRESAHRAAAKDAYDRPLVGGMKGARFGHWWRRRDGEEIFAVPREDSPAHRPKTIPASPSMPIAPYCPAKVFRSQHMAKGRTRSPQCRSSQSPRPPPTVGVGSSRSLAKIPPPTTPKTIPANPSMPIAPYCPAKVPPSQHMAKGRARSSQCQSSYSPRPPPTVGAGSSRFLAKIPPPTIKTAKRGCP